MLRPRKPILLSDVVYGKMGNCTVGLALEGDLYASFEGCDHELISGTTNHNFAIETRFNCFSQLYRLQGQIVVNHADECVGRVQDFEKTAKHLAIETGADPRIVTRHLKALVSGVSNELKEEAQEWFKNTAKAKSERTKQPIAVSRWTPCWFFEGENSSSAKAILTSGDVRLLPFRLGLPSHVQGTIAKSTIVYVGFCVKSSKLSNLRVPSIFDVSYLDVREYWSPGGLTVPLPSSPPSVIAVGGLKELVAQPPNLSDIDPDIVMFTCEMV
jgi:hypothetical protein